MSIKTDIDALIEKHSKTKAEKWNKKREIMRALARQRARDAREKRKERLARGIKKVISTSKTQAQIDRDEEADVTRNG